MNPDSSFTTAMIVVSPLIKRAADLCQGGSPATAAERTVKASLNFLARLPGGAALSAATEGHGGRTELVHMLHIPRKRASLNRSPQEFASKTRATAGDVSQTMRGLHGDKVVHRPIGGSARGLVH